MMIGIRPERLAEYRGLHAEPWPEMQAALWSANIRNYSIYLAEDRNLLFAHWDYVGHDFHGDMARLGEMEVTRRWLALTDPCQVSFNPDGKGWTFLPEVYRLDPA